MWVKILLLFFVFSFLFRTDTAFDQDLGRHLKLGEIIFQTGSVPHANLFSYTNPDFPFINTHWLFEVLVYGVSQTIGLQWMLIFKIVAILLSVWLAIKTIPKDKQVLLLPLGFIFLHALRERLELRPEIFSFLFTATTFYILEKYLRGSTKLTFLLPITQLIWVNTHIYFFVGLALQAIYLIDITIHQIRSHISGGKLKLLSVIFILSVLVSLINPNGLKGLLYPLNVNKNYGYTIVENQTIFLLEGINFKDPNFLFVKLSVSLIVLSLIVTLFRRQWQPKFILLSISGLVLALMHVRSFPYLVLLALPATIQNFGFLKQNFLTRALIFLTVPILLLESYLYLNGDYYKYTDNPHQAGLTFVESSNGAMDFVLAHDLPGPLYNNFDIGGYILYRGYPKYLVFVDGRPEAYPASFFSGIYIPSQSDYKNFKEVEKIYQFKTIIFSHTDQTPWGKTFLQNAVKDEDWNLVYIDDFMLILVKAEVAKDKKLHIVDLAKLNPTSFVYTNHVSYLRIGFFLLSTGNNQPSEQFIRKTMQVFPDSPVANQMVGNIEKATNKFFW